MIEAGFVLLLLMRGPYSTMPVAIKGFSSANECEGAAAVIEKKFPEVKIEHVCVEVSR